MVQPKKDFLIIIANCNGKEKESFSWLGFGALKGSLISIGFQKHRP